jgi:hypothetical protein
MVALFILLQANPRFRHRVPLLALLADNPPNL